MTFKELYDVLECDMLIKVYDTDYADEDVLNDLGLVYNEKAYYLEGSFTWMEIENKKVCYINTDIYDNTPVMKIFVTSEKR